MSHGEDAAGNWETATASATFIKDTVAPIVTLGTVTSPSNNTQPTFTGTAGTVTGNSAHRHGYDLQWNGHGWDRG